MSNILENKINIFYKKKNDIFRKPLEKIINNMLNKCKYINNESLERHNWGNTPLKLKSIPENINSDTFEYDLLYALEKSDQNDYSIIELLWGDIQLGKRIQACIIMWISIYILNRPVLYIFRNLIIDQKQLNDDIVGTDKYNFNIQFIKTIFDEFNLEIQNYFNEDVNEYWKEYKLPDLKDINNNENIYKLSNKNFINITDIYCCLMNYKQLEKINKIFNNYIFFNKELVNITILVDESDLMAPTSSNDNTCNNDLNHSTLCEQLLVKIYKKVKYVLHITGTAHSLLYNITTKLNSNTSIQMKISKVHKMIRSNDYYGLFNNSIHFKTDINEWWNNIDIEDKNTYNILDDYNFNIKNIINIIINRTDTKYNSLLISEEKIKQQQFLLINRILKDFSDIFVIIYHGNCLRLYLSKKYENEIIYWSKQDGEESIHSPRLYQEGGIYNSSENIIYFNNHELLPNNYCYFKINTKILNIKLIYKLLRILFDNSINIKYKTVITITGRYGERGYSFTSDDYEKYSFHLTDQYYISHASFNCTNISQKLRLQGKYNDIELQNGTMKLFLWTTTKLKNIMEEFYINFIKRIENKIMDCNNWEEIKTLIENIIDIGDLQFKEHIKYIDIYKKRKNITCTKIYVEEYNGYKLTLIDSSINENLYIKNFCEYNNLPPFQGLINDIKSITKTDFINIYGIEGKQELLQIIDNEHIINKNYNDIINIINNFIKKTNLDYIFPQMIDLFNDNDYEWIEKRINKSEDLRKGKKNHFSFTTKYDNNNFYFIIIYYIKILPPVTHDYIKLIPYKEMDNNIIIYSTIKEEYQKTIKNINIAYIKTIDDWLLLYNKDKQPEKSLTNLNISLPLSALNESELYKDIILFFNSNCSNSEYSNSHTITYIYNKYKIWCINNDKNILIKKEFNIRFNKLYKNFKKQNKYNITII